MIIPGWTDRKVQIMKNAFVAMMIPLFITGTAFASQCDTPEKTAKAYIQYDLEGARLGSDVSARIDKLETENRFEPAWDDATLVTGYEIKSIKQKGQEGVVTIVFKNAWETSTRFKFEEIKDEIVEMHLKESAGCWKVAPPFYKPHLYSESIVNHLEKLIKSDAETAGKDWLEYTQAELNSVLQYRKVQQPGLRERKPAP
jgi:hypothetical protein